MRLRPVLLFEFARDAELPCFSRSVDRHGKRFAELLRVPVFRPHNICLLLLSTCGCSSLWAVRLPNVRHWDSDFHFSVLLWTGGWFGSPQLKKQKQSMLLLSHSLCDVNVPAQIKMSSVTICPRPSFVGCACVWPSRVTCSYPAYTEEDAPSAGTVLESCICTFYHIHGGSGTRILPSAFYYVLKFTNKPYVFFEIFCAPKGTEGFFPYAIATGKYSKGHYLR